MKLLNKSTLYFILFLLPVFVISWFILLNLITCQVNDNADESLLAQKKVIIKNFIETDSTESQYFNDADDDVVIKSLPDGSPIQDIFTDTFYFDSTEKELVPFRRLTSSFSNDGKMFEIRVTRSNIKRDELAKSISIGLLIMFVLILITVVILNRFISERLFKPFYQTLEKLQRISFVDAEPNIFHSSSTKEFKELNKALNFMTAKMFADYANQKQFTENASHELQTPLAIMRTRIDMLIQDKNLSEESLEQIQEIEKSVNKLSHLNKSLLLLSKIENRQFDETTAIDLQNLLDKILSDFEDSLNSKNLQVQREYSGSPMLHMNPLLADILFSNLIQNACRHNIMNGIIHIELKPEYVMISNSGPPLAYNEDRIFERFTKFNDSIESLGLGLSIVKQICMYYSLVIKYQFVKGQHSFTIKFMS